MASTSVTLEAVEAFMASRTNRGLAFPPAIEQQFEADTRDRRCQRLITGMLVSVAIYNLLLVTDWLLVPDVFWHAVVWHLGVVTPWMLTAAWLISKRPPQLLRECLAASVPLIIMVQIDSGFAVTASESAAHYQYVVIPTLLYANVSLHRLVFPFARAVSATIVVGHSVLALTVGHLTSGEASMVIVHLVVAAYITLVANFQMERDLRRAYLFSLRDRLRHAQAEAASRRDALTGLANRHHLDDELRKLWASPQADGAPVAVVMADIDHFKLLNDRYGHAAGDLTLKRIAAILTAELRGPQDHAVRFGGEEFLLLFPNMDMVGAMRVAERMRRAVEKAAIPNEAAGLRGIVTASFGVAAAAATDLAAMELVEAADNALYAAKRRGRNQVWPPLAATEEPAAPVAIIPQRQSA